MPRAAVYARRGGARLRRSRRVAGSPLAGGVLPTRDTAPIPGAITYVGHATVLVELDGARLLTDPILRTRILHLRRSGTIPADAARGIDAVLVSHAHWDHLDLPSLERLGPCVPVVAPRGTGRLLRRRRLESVIEVDVDERVRLGGLDVTATRAAHDGGRGPLGVRAPALGFVIAGSRRVYFAGDTDLFAEMAALAPLDVALVPVSGWGKATGRGHLDPRRAAEALSLLEPKVAVPIHWGSLAPLHRPAPTAHAAWEFRRHAAEIAPAVDVRILQPGESMPIE